MAAVDFFALAGGRLRVEGPDVENWPIAMSVARIDGPLGNLTVESGAKETVDVRMVQGEGVVFDEHYDHSGGQLSIGAAHLYDPDTFFDYGVQHVFSWRSGRNAVWGKTTDRDKRWLIDFVTTIDFKATSHSTQIAPRRRGEFRVGIPDTAAFSLSVVCPSLGYISPVSSGSSVAMKSKAAAHTRAGGLDVFRFNDARNESTLLLSDGKTDFSLQLIESGVQSAAIEHLSRFKTFRWFND
jgi:hypothetical protein